MRTVPLTLALLVGGSARAAIVVPLPDEALVAKADTIVFGTVVHTRTLVGPGGEVSTQADVQVYRGLRGAHAGEVIVLQVPGGDLGNGVVAEVAGAPTLAPGDMVFGFLETRSGARRPLGLSFGLLSVRGVGPGDLRVFRDLEGLQLADTAGSRRDVSAYVVAGVPLETYIGRIQAILRKPPSLPDALPPEVQP